MAKPNPSLPPDCVRMKVLIPTSWPSAFTSGPPLLPGLMGASVCTYAMTSSGLICRATELTTPMLTEFSNAQRAAEGHDQLALAKLVGIAELQKRQSGSFHFDQRQVRVAVHAHHVRFQHLAPRGGCAWHRPEPAPEPAAHSQPRESWSRYIHPRSESRPSRYRAPG